MEIIPDNYTYKHVGQLTDKEWKSFKQYIINNTDFATGIMESIIEDIPYECKKLNSKKYDFVCENILYTRQNVPDSLYKLQYVGNEFTYIQVSDTTFLGVETVIYDDMFDCYTNPDTGIVFNIYSKNDPNTDVNKKSNSNIKYDETFGINDFNKNKDSFQKYYELSDREMTVVSIYIKQVSTNIQAGYKPFRNDIERINVWYENTMAFVDKYLREYLNRFPELGIFLDENGNVIDHNFDYDE